MEDIIDKHIENIYKSEKLFECVEEVTGIDKQTILSQKRDSEIAMARNIIGYMLYKEIGVKTTQAGKILKRDHSTIVYYAKTFETNYNYYKEYRDVYSIVNSLFWSNFVAKEEEDIDLQVKSLQSLIEKLKNRTEYLLIKNH